MKTVKNILKVIPFICVGFSTQAELRSAKAISHKIEKSEFSANLTDGFHFNEKAPNAVVVDGNKVLPTLIKPTEIKFKINAPKNATAFLYICDDKLTFCETHKIDLGGNVATNSKSKKQEKDKKDEHGFNQVSFGKALRSTKDLMLLDFTAKWCPGCVRFSTEVFNKPEFSALAKDLYKLKVDVDLFENFELSERYKIKGIPTLIITDKMGHEIHRLVGFEPMARVKNYITDAKKNSTTLKKYSDQYQFKNNEEKLAAGIRFFDADEFETAISLLQDVQPAPYQLAGARVQLTRELFEKDEKIKENKDKYIAVLREAIAFEPKTTRSLAWRTELIKLIETNKSEVEAIKTEGEKVADELLKDPAALKQALLTDSTGEFNGFDKWVVLMYKLDLLEAAGVADPELEKIYAEAAKVGMEAKIPAKLRGPNLRLLVMLTGSKNWLDAEKHVTKMIKEDPKNTDLKRRQVKILLSLEKYKEAREVAESILNKVEGRNEFWVAESLAKAFIGLKDTDSAKKVILVYLAKPEIEEAKMKSLKKSFETLLASANPSK